MKTIRMKKMINILIILTVIFTTVIPSALPANAAAVKTSAVGYAKGRAVIRKSASIHSKKVSVLKNGSKLVVYKEVFTSKTSTKAAYRWYYVASGRKKGYVRSDQIRNIKYTAKKTWTTDNLFYRVGVGKKMSRKGMYKKGAAVTVVLDAYQRGSKEKWHKVKVGKKYYYAHAGWISAKKPTAKKTTAKTTSAKKTTSNNTTSAPSGVATITTKSGNVVNTVTGASIPQQVAYGCPFTLKGKVTSTSVINSAAVAIVKSDGTNAICVRKTVGSKTFDISEADAEVKFGTLPAGTYKYLVKIYVPEGGFAVIYSKFKVIRSRKAELIANKALELAWPQGTAKKTYSYKTGYATPAFQKAINAVFPNRSRWGNPPRAGASCDVFAGTVIRASGVDASVPRGLQEQFPYFANSKKWKRVNFKGDKSVLRNGDVVMYYLSNAAHILIYVKKGSKDYVVEAHYDRTYGMVSSSSDLRERLNNKGKRYYIYRIVE